TPTRRPPPASPEASASSPETTVATIWCPRMRGGEGISTSPSSRCRSVRQTAHARTRRSSCPGPGWGIGRCTSRSGCPTSSKTIARIVPAGVVCAIVTQVKHARVRACSTGRSAEEQLGGLVQLGVEQLRLAQRVLEFDLDDLRCVYRDH